MKQSGITVTATAAVLFYVLSVQAQETDPPVRAGVYASFEQIADIDYGQPAHAAGLFIEGEPIVLQVGILNPYADRDAGAEQRWPDLVSLTVRPGSMRSLDAADKRPVVCDAAKIQGSPSVRLQGDVVVVPPGGRQFFLCAIDPQKNALVGGIHTVEMHWKPTVDVERLGVGTRLDLLGGALDFEFRPVTSEADQADLWLRLGYRALLEGRLNDAENWIGEVLLAHPQSSTAFAIKGRILGKRGHCRAGANALNRAADILVGRLEGDDNNPRHRDQGQRASIAGHWRQEARQLACRDVTQRADVSPLNQGRHKYEF